MNAEHPARLLALPATMLLLVLHMSSARADRAENAFVIVEGDGVVRLDGKNFAILSSGKGESFVRVTAQPGWKLDTPSSAKVSAAKPLRYKATDASHEGSGTGRISGLTATFITPAGNPVNAPVDSGEGQNEFTFSTASTGTLMIGLKVKIDPALSHDQAPEGDFSIDGIGNSAKQWAAANPNGRASYSGGYYTATVTFSGLPANNSAFGKKTVTFSVADVTITQAFEVFFPKDGTNHPACSSCTNCPNWFFYWRQLKADNNTVVYNPSLPFPVLGETPAMTEWSYERPCDKSRVVIGYWACEKTTTYSSFEEYSGIDLFLATCIHENVHVLQIKEADALCPISNGNDCFRYGWSWKTDDDNHWDKGDDDEWGEAWTDDDFNGIVDDAAPIPPFEPGNGDDNPTFRTGHGSRFRDWPDCKLVPNPDYEVFPEESEAVNTTDDAIDEDEHAMLDWSNPGKQHQSGSYDD